MRMTLKDMLNLERLVVEQLRMEAIGQREEYPVRTEGSFITIENKDLSCQMKNIIGDEQSVFGHKTLSKLPSPKQVMIESVLPSVFATVK